MRVPSIGLPLDERRIVREGYRIAEHMLRDYADPPSHLQTLLRGTIAPCRRMARNFFCALIRN